LLPPVWRALRFSIFPLLGPGRSGLRLEFAPAEPKLRLRRRRRASSLDRS